MKHYLLSIKNYKFPSTSAFLLFFIDQAGFETSRFGVTRLMLLLNTNQHYSNILPDQMMFDAEEIVPVVVQMSSWSDPTADNDGYNYI